MRDRQYILTINPENGDHACNVLSVNPDMLAILGRIYHEACEHKPLLTISDSDGSPMLVMDQWATTWRTPTPEETATAAE